MCLHRRHLPTADIDQTKMIALLISRASTLGNKTGFEMFMFH